MIRVLTLLAAGLASAQSRESIEEQKRSVARQREAIARFRGRQAAIEAPEPACEPVAEESLAPLIEGAAKARQLPARLLRSVIARESGFRPCAVSKKGAQGLMQLMPETADRLGVEDPFDPEANIAAGSKYLRQLIEKYAGDLGLALAAYNAGPAAIDEAKGIPDIPETRDYVDAILRNVGIKRIDLPSSPKPRPTEN